MVRHVFVRTPQRRDRGEVEGLGEHSEWTSAEGVQLALRVGIKRVYSLDVKEGK